jgi:hypothetical protein
VDNWVLINRLSELIGYSKEAIYQKKKKGVWAQGKHWRKAPDNRLAFNVKTIQEWIANG